MANFATNNDANSKLRQIVVDVLETEDKNLISIKASKLLKGTLVTSNECTNSTKGTFKVSAFIYRPRQILHNLSRFPQHVYHYHHCEKLIFYKTATRFCSEIFLTCYVLLLCW